MPWSASEAKEHTKKADTPAKQRKWAAIANNALKTYKGDEGKAIATANAAMSDSFWMDGLFLEDQFEIQHRPRPNRDRRTTYSGDDDRSSVLDDSTVMIAADALNDGQSIVRLSDKIDIQDANVKFTKDGFMTARPRTARTGIQLYTGDECQRPDMDIVKVYRPPEEVFDKAALASYTHRPTTLDHPPEDVNAGNWKKYAVGHTGDEILRDGETFRVPMVLMDGAAVATYKDQGVKELSWGYDCFLDWTPGEIPDGQPNAGQKYDAVQRHLRANHLAVVTSARGGSALNIGDKTTVDDEAAGDTNNNDRSTTMQMKQLTLDGIEVEVPAHSAVFITRTIKDLEKQLDAANKKIKTKEDEDEDRDEEDKKKDAATAELTKKVEALTATGATKDAEIVTLKKQIEELNTKTSPAALDSLVAERLDVIKKARALIGDRAVIESKPVTEIRKEVVLTKVGDTAKNWNDDMIKASFDTMPLYNPNANAMNGRRTQLDTAREAFAGRPGPGYETMETSRTRLTPSVTMTLPMLG